ncbi:MAG: hypothetical protein ACJ72E_07900 [Marmoricola sp.]
MSWTETHRRWQALQEIEALANAGCEHLPWNTEYAEIFGDPGTLADALRYRWRLNRDAQLDTHLSEAVLEEQRTRIEQRHAGVLRLLQNWDAGEATYARFSCEDISEPETLDGPVNAA